MSLRRFPIRLLVAVVSLLTLGAAGADTESPRIEVRRVAPGVYVHSGAYEQSSPANGGDIANIGFVVGQRCVAVIDTGGSRAVGRGLREAVRRKTEKPVCYVINTHMHPDHVLGNAAFLEDDPVFIAHHRLSRALAARQSSYRQSQGDALGRAVAEDWFVYPEETVSDRRRLRLGGRSLLLEARPTAHTSNDLTVLDERTGTWWLGDLLFVERMPTLDGSLTGWLDLLGRLKERRVERVVPGHGPASVAWPEAGRPLARYLENLRRRTRAALDQGKSLAEALAAAERRANEQWVLFRQVHPRNVTKAYAELEWK
ncbi:quinoprotein relay system zinc metallohydrolase 2 [Thiohalorhabdus methylotrophus]|uniref:Quinoprotein relay system zinc metallohydrolase 2 n=1 Tax=Thiohalorhabdus methylotrophus TaxID=3242694 RepID=A0ABV4TUT1_9GAMM